MSNSANVWSVENLSVKYDGLSALYNISFEIAKGRLVAVIGPNGAGKSTLLKSCLGFIEISGGKVSFFGKPLRKVRDRVAYIPQRSTLDWDFPITVFDFVLMGIYGKRGLWGKITKNDKSCVQDCLEKVGLSQESSRQISQLSGGQQQKAFLARALMQGAELYLMDEPFSALDVSSFRNLMDILKILKTDGKTIVVICHDLHNVRSYFDDIVLMNKRLIAFGSVEEAFSEENILTAYGGDTNLFNDALTLDRLKSKGIDL